MTRFRTDIIDVYVVRRAPRRLEVLQLRRVQEPLAGTWQPVMGHARRAETAVACMWRELKEETGLTRRSPALRSVWALESVNPYFISAIDAIVLSARFVVEVADDWTPRLNHEHDDVRWVDVRHAPKFFLWPGQVAVAGEIRMLFLSRAGPRFGERIV